MFCVHANITGKIAHKIIFVIMSVVFVITTVLLIIVLFNLSSNENSIKTNI